MSNVRAEIDCEEGKAMTNHVVCGSVNSKCPSDCPHSVPHEPITTPMFTTSGEPAGTMGCDAVWSICARRDDLPFVLCIEVKP